eukprot:2442595-Lingulodinium_polyedra.AAC.1
MPRRAISCHIIPLPASASRVMPHHATPTSCHHVPPHNVTAHRATLCNEPILLDASRHPSARSMASAT